MPDRHGNLQVLRIREHQPRQRRLVAELGQQLRVGVIGGDVGRGRIIAMDRDVMHLRDMLAPRFAELIYYGFWYSPEMDFLRAAFDQAEKLIDGRVLLTLYKGNVIIEGRESHSSLYDPELASMDVEGGYNQSDATGFIKLQGLRLRAHKVILRDPSTR